MRNLSDVTEAEVKAAYDSTPSFNQYVPWAEVKANPLYITLLKNQIIAHQEEQAMEQIPNQNNLFLAVNNHSKPPHFKGQSSQPATAQQGAQPQPQSQPQAHSKTITRRSTITLHERQINQLTSALSLARNCLQCGHVNENLKSEALQELAASQKIIKSFYQRT